MHRARLSALTLAFALITGLALSGPADSLALDVGISTILEPGPPYVFLDGDTIRPRALVRNYGTETARNFDVRFRIDPGYEHTIVVPSLEPGTGLEVRFQPWVATPGNYTAVCTTRLEGDENPENDRASADIRVLRPLSLRVTPDRADSIEAGATHRYRFQVEMHGDVGDSVLLLPPAHVPGWRAVYYDSAGTVPLADGKLGYVGPQERRTFVLAVSAPSALTDTDPAAAHEFIVVGVAAGDPPVRDSARLTLTLIPSLQAHNYPNPFGFSTTFIIGIPEDATLSLTVYDRVGTLIRRVLDAETHAGPGVVRRQWNGTNSQGRLIAPGTYQYLLEVTRGGRTDRVVRHLVLTRE